MGLAHNAVERVRAADFASGSRREESPAVVELFKVERTNGSRKEETAVKQRRKKEKTVAGVVDRNGNFWEYADTKKQSAKRLIRIANGYGKRLA